MSPFLVVHGVHNLVTIQGENFGATRDGGNVTFDGVGALEYVTWGDTEIQVRSPRDGNASPSDVTPRSTPGTIPDLTNAAAIAAGDDHSLALTNDGRLWAWGWNHDGQLGLDDSSDRTSPEIVDAHD